MNHWSSEVKIRAVKIYLNSDITQTNVAKMFEITPRTLQRWIEDYKNTGSLDRKKQHYTSYKIKENQYPIKLQNSK